jgi:hypothetical protein
MAARAMIQRCGTNAAMEADKATNKGDMKTSRIWFRIMQAIEMLQSEKPEPGETVQ